MVVKADGLAAGKGVTVAEDAEQARAALSEIFVEDRFGSSGATRSARPSAVVEELLFGEELSLLALCDGVRAVPMAPARDFKRIFDGDRGPNTGGMGSYSPVAGFDASSARELANAVHQPIVDLMRERGTPFHGVLYAGLMLTADGPKVLEFNVRFGDPETQAVLPRLRSDLLEVLLAAARPGGLEGLDLDWSEDWAVTLVLASAGYPASSSEGDEIRGLEQVPAGIEVTHAGTTIHNRSSSPPVVACWRSPHWGRAWSRPARVRMLPQARSLSRECNCGGISPRTPHLRPQPRCDIVSPLSKDPPAYTGNDPPPTIQR